MSLKKKSKVLIPLVTLLILLGGFIAYKIAYKPHKTIEEQEISFKGEALGLLEMLQNNPDQFQNNIVAINGVITSKDEKGIVLDDNVYCQFKDAVSLVNLKKGEALTVKARVIGYDDLLEELKLDKAIIYNP